MNNVKKNLFWSISIVMLIMFLLPGMVLADDIDVPPGSTGDVNGTENDDTITVQGGADVEDVYGDQGDDTIIVQAGAQVDDVKGDRTSSEAGNDTIENNGTAEFISGQAGNDNITNNGTVTDTGTSIMGGDGDDVIVNNGTVEGDLKDKGGDDTLINNGLVKGGISAWSQNDDIDMW